MARHEAILEITKPTRHFQVVSLSFPNTPLLTGANKQRCCLLAAHQSLNTTCVRATGNSLKKQILADDAGLLVTASSPYTPLFKMAHITGSVGPSRKNTVLTVSNALVSGRYTTPS
jgi:hypothetical protein